MNNYEELQGYQPDFYKDILEMQDILKVSGDKLDLIEESIIDIENNAFIVTMSEWGIERWEKALKIPIIKSKPLVDRLALVLATRIGPGKLTGSKIKAMAQVYSSDMVDVSYDNITKTIKIKFQDIENVLDSYKDLMNLLKKRKPLNIQIGTDFILRVLSNIISPVLYEEIKSNIKVASEIEVENMCSLKENTKFLIGSNFNPSNNDELYLDGSWSLDGSFSLDGVNYLGVNLYFNSSCSLKITTYKNNILISQEVL